MEPQIYLIRIRKPKLVFGPKKDPTQKIVYSKRHQPEMSRIQHRKDEDEETSQCIGYSLINFEIELHAYLIKIWSSFYTPAQVVQMII